MCNGGPACNIFTFCCGDGCHDLNNDIYNCGACGNVCNGDELCCAGKCLPTGPENCGTCGKSCGGLSCCGCGPSATCGDICPLSAFHPPSGCSGLPQPTRKRIKPPTTN
jgi:hypothetical protein